VELRAGDGRSAARLGVLTPSSNTVLEPLMAAMVAPLSVTAHFSRFRVVEISLEDDSVGQFDLGPMLAAADLLADADVDAIVWSGTSAGWLGLDADAELCRSIEAQTGIPATTSALALVEVLRATGAKRLGLVTPYVDAVQAGILETLRAAGFENVAERHLGLRDNRAFASVSGRVLRRLVLEVAGAAPDAITTFCTNLRAAPLVPELERETGVPVYDTVSLGVWHGLALAGLDPRGVTGWGRLFDEAVATPAPPS
jgi:maleate isomerase